MNSILDPFLQKVPCQKSQRYQSKSRSYIFGFTGKFYRQKRWIIWNIEFFEVGYEILVTLFFLVLIEYACTVWIPLMDTIFWEQKTYQLGRISGFSVFSRIFRKFDKKITKHINYGTSTVPVLGVRGLLCRLAENGAKHLFWSLRM